MSGFEVYPILNCILIVIVNVLGTEYKYKEYNLIRLSNLKSIREIALNIISKMALVYRRVSEVSCFTTIEVCCVFSEL